MIYMGKKKKLEGTAGFVMIYVQGKPYLVDANQPRNR